MKVYKDYEQFQQAIRDQIADSKLSLRKIEAETGISRQHLNGFKHNERGMLFEKLIVLADYFQVSYLFTNTQ